VTTVNAKLVDFYNAGDQIFRLATFFKRMETNGGNAKEAADWVNKFYPDYSRLPKWAARFKQTPFAAPFVSFMLEQPRVHANALLHNPAKAALIMGGLLAF